MPNTGLISYCNLLILVFICSSVLSSEIQSFAGPPDSIDGAKIYTYHTINNFNLPLYVFVPDNVSDSNKKRSSVVFFHGSGWKSGSVLQFESYARKLSGQGIVAVLAEYRVKDTYGATPFDGLKDVKSAIRWLRVHADELSIDKDKVVAAGASSGGHLALSAAIFDDQYNNEQDDLSISAIPDALILFAPVVDTSIRGYNDAEGLKLFSGLNSDLSPIEHIKPGLPPALILHGDEDKWIPIESINRYTELSSNMGNKTELIPFKNRGHHFYNHPDYLRSRNIDNSLSNTSEFMLCYNLIEKFFRDIKFED